MNFQQLGAAIPMVDSVISGREGRTLTLADGLHALIIVQEGYVLIDTDGQQPIPCTQGYAVHSSRGRCSVHLPKTRESEYLIVFYRISPEQAAWPLEGLLTTNSDIKIRYMADEMFRTFQLLPGCEEEEASAQRFRMRLMLERALFIFLYDSGIMRNRKAPDAMEEAVSYIDEHYMNKLPLAMLAKRAGMSDGHFTVLFKKHTGRTLSHYLREVRVGKAKQLLGQTRMSAKEIAQSVGFADYFHFSRVFKHEVGCSPSEYRQHNSAAF